MLFVYLTQAFRSISKNKTHVFLTVASLAASISCLAFIAVSFQDDWSYDKFNANYSRILRLTDTETTQSGIKESSVWCESMVSAFKNHCPGVGQASRSRLREDTVEYNSEQIVQTDILLADPSFFDVLNYRLKRGD